MKFKLDENSRLAEGLLDALEAGTVRGKLWVVEPSRIREHEPEDLPPE